MFLSDCRWATAGLGALCLLAAATRSGAQTALPPASAPAPVAALEYFVDNDPGAGLGTAVAVTAATDLTAAASIPLTGIPAGIHRLYLRAKDAAGTWGPCTLQPLYLAPGFAITAPAILPLTALEYFFDTDPGPGLATPVAMAAGTDFRTTGNLNAASLAAGVHYLGIRARNAAGTWGLTNFNPVYVLPSIALPAHAPASAIVRAEYFVDTDPGQGLATAIPVSTGTDLGISGLIASIGSTAAGTHQIGFRFQDAAGNWSLTDRNKFSVIVANISVPPAIAPQAFSSLEYFIDTDPGLGNGTLLNVPATIDLSNFAFAASLPALASGTHVLYVRTVGDWSLSSSQAFRVASPLPVTLRRFDGRRQQSAVQLDWECAAEAESGNFVIERSGDASSYDSIGFVRSNTGQETYHFLDQRPLSGLGYYRLKQQDHSGKISYSRTIAIHFSNADQAVFSCNNPVSHELRIFRSRTAAEPETFRILNQQGREVVQFCGSGEMIERRPVSQLPAGNYTIQISAGPHSRTLRFQKI